MGDTTSPTPARTLRWIDVTTLASGLPLRVAVHEIRGARPGPTVGITASIHGDELAPVEAIRRLMETLSPADLSGRAQRLLGELLEASAAPAAA